MISARASAQAIVSRVSLHHGFTTSVAKRKPPFSLVPERHGVNDNANTGKKQYAPEPAHLPASGRFRPAFTGALSRLREAAEKEAYQ
jgi:hypothetical protein